MAKQEKRNNPFFNTNNKSNTPGEPRKTPRFGSYWAFIIILAIMLAFQLFNPLGSSSKRITEDEFKTLIIQGKVGKYVLVDNRNMVRVWDLRDSAKTAADNDKSLIGGSQEQQPQYYFKISDPERFPERMSTFFKDHPEVKKPESDVDPESDFFGKAIGYLLPFVLLLGVWILLMRKMSGGAGGAGGPGGIFSIGKSKATLFDKGTKVNITFADVAGLDEAKGEVMEIVDFLKNPKKYTSLGGKIPKGALLVGPPGTGKTLLAKAMAGEAQVPFFSLSGSDFVEMFVGVGASRVRDLFKQAREKAPCVIFIDEIDAIGRARGKNAMMSNDERESTLNQMLVEMDGFGTDSGIIVLAATNRPDVLDSALLRPGRFDRQISIDKPDLAGREAIFKVHLKEIKTSKNLDIHKLAAQTPGFAGADIANVCNEAALIAARKDKQDVEMQDFNDAIDRIIGGLEKKNKIILPDEKRVIAYHEAGHAVTGWFLEHAHPLLKVTIVPRGTAALGFAQYLPKEKYLTLTEELEDDMCMTLGGRASEETFFGKISTGALSDLQQVTRTAYAMVSVYGMNQRIGNISFYDPQNENGFHKPYSEETGKLIDEEVKKLSDKAYARAKALIEEKKEEVRIIAEELLQKEVLFKDDLERLIGKRPFEEKKTLPEVVLPTTSGDVDPNAILPIEENKDTPPANAE
ncbi:ATP-dependent zinc metalloprotease FtsH [Niabella insulamsoli]|uniref:ATP-dependent zinc metalloprotease FtsH n=1 Tax=Niabella insulamsoli TaxID=3144874 RepID=UPI0031FCC712